MVAWVVFTLSQLFKLVYKAVMAKGDEHNIWQAAKSYFTDKPVSILMRVFIAQFAFFGIWDNPALVGNLFGVVGAGALPMLPTRWWLAGLLGMGSDTLADMVIAAGAWVQRRWQAFFGNGNTTGNGDVDINRDPRPPRT